MRHSNISGDEAYETATRKKYQDRALARHYHREFTGFTLSPNDWFVRLVSGYERRAVAKLLARVRPETKTIADIPCGTGKLFPIFESQQLRVFGCDVSGEMLEIARETASEAGGVAGLVRLDATQLPFRSASLDTVVCLRLMHRIPTEIKRGILKELHRVSARYAIISVGLTTPWQRVRATLRRMLTGRTTVPFPLTPGQVEELLAETGWRASTRSAVLPVLSAEQLLLLERR